KEVGMSNPVLEKANRIHEAGLIAVENGEVVGFRWPGDLIQRFNCSVRFDDSVLNLFRVLQEVSDSALEGNVALLLAGVHYPLHCTLGEGLTSDGSVAPDEFIFDGGAHELIGEEWSFSELVVDKGNLLLAASEIPNLVLTVRVSLEAFYTRMGLKPMPIKDLLHISLARIRSGGKEGIRTYAYGLLQMRNLVSRNPIRFRVNRIYTGSAKKLLLG
ncbi:MAG TPA: hypothetical protein VJH94_02355, partial [Candidatus Paceibacterota bacterium]